MSSSTSDDEPAGFGYCATPPIDVTDLPGEEIANAPGVDLSYNATVDVFGGYRLNGPHAA